MEQVRYLLLNTVARGAMLTEITASPRAPDQPNPKHPSFESDEIVGEAGGFFLLPKCTTVLLSLSLKTIDTCVLANTVYYYMDWLKRWSKKGVLELSRIEYTTMIASFQVRPLHVVMYLICPHFTVMDTVVCPTAQDLQAIRSFTDLHFKIGRELQRLLKEGPRVSPTQ